MESTNKNVIELTHLKKKIKQVEGKILALEKKKRIEKKYSHAHSDSFDSEIRHLHIEKRNFLKRKEKLEKKIKKLNSKSHP